MCLAIADNPAIRQLIVELKTELNSKEENGSIIKEEDITIEHEISRPRSLSARRGSVNLKWKMGHEEMKKEAFLRQCSTEEENDETCPDDTEVSKITFTAENSTTKLVNEDDGEETKLKRQAQKSILIKT